MPVVERRWRIDVELTPPNPVANLFLDLDARPLLEAKRAGRGVLRRAYISIDATWLSGDGIPCEVYYATRKGEWLKLGELHLAPTVPRDRVERYLDVNNEFVPAGVQLVQVSMLLAGRPRGGRMRLDIYMWYSYT